MLSSDVLPLIDQAASRVYSVVKETPLVAMPLGAGERGAAFAKLEQLQITGSFKLRGATNKLMSLSKAAAAAGVITSSTGNHGLGVATAAKLLGIDAEVFLSSQVTTAKRDRIRERGARIRIVGEDPLAAELAARAAASESGRTYISPYNDPYVVAGQGTIGVELMRQAPDLDALFIATGGGGLISGIGSYLRHVAPGVEVIGCWPENSAVLYECIKAGRIFGAPETATLSESTAGGVEEGSITFDLCREVMHRGVLVTEDEILRAMRWGHVQGWAVEGASGVALAAYFKDAARYANKKTAVLICGGNPSPAIAALLEPAT
ncbi:MAG TPA: threonine/serine dehydratase [Steroidobacteraceae bacterium]|nr:threonine/serine dehydratase [Steroidobacteraceae bacterium]